jgi:hypothetical protein
MQRCAKSEANELGCVVDVVRVQAQCQFRLCHNVLDLMAAHASLCSGANWSAAAMTTVVLQGFVAVVSCKVAEASRWQRQRL